MGAAGIATARDVYMIASWASMPDTTWRPSQAGERVTYLIAAICVFHDRPGLVQARVRCPAGRSFLRLPACSEGCGSFLACVLAGCRGGAWLKKGLPSWK